MAAIYSNYYKLPHLWDLNKNLTATVNAHQAAVPQWHCRM